MPGISAFLRIKNEEEWIGPCVESILSVFDEIVVCFQHSTDRSEEIVRHFDDPKIRIFHYPFDSHPNGPGHDAHPEDSVHARAYFYNWSLQQTRYEFACKWDGDGVAMDGLGEAMRAATRQADLIYFRGIDIVGEDWVHMSKEPFTGYEPSLFRVAPNTFYETGTLCEVFHKPNRWARVLGRYTPFGLQTQHLQTPAFLHFKWAKSFESASKAWPEDWQNQPHFQAIMQQKATQGERYDGEYPDVLRRLIAEKNMQAVHG